jgi:hypothetical protein
MATIPDPSPLTRTATEGLARLMDGPPGPERLNGALRYLAKWRSVLLENTLVARSGDTVLAGPFAGMAYPFRVTEGSRTTRLLGAYEASLFPVIETLISRAYPLIIDVGCAGGYYAVGLARRMPDSMVMARDSNPAARVSCAQLADANGVASRVRIGAEMTHTDFAVCAAQPTLILCDIEGDEGALIDPALAPGLLHADILVEVHEGMHPGLLATLSARFEATHSVTRIDRVLRPDFLPGWTDTLSDLDRLLLLWEWRATPTPWLWMDRR